MLLVTVYCSKQIQSRLTAGKGLTRQSPRKTRGTIQPSPPRGLCFLLQEVACDNTHAVLPTREARPAQPVSRALIGVSSVVPCSLQPGGPSIDSVMTTAPKPVKVVVSGRTFQGLSGDLLGAGQRGQTFSPHVGTAQTCQLSLRWW